MKMYKDADEEDAHRMNPFSLQRRAAVADVGVTQ